MITIQLPNGEWGYDPGAPLGPAGGFGEVFLGTGPNGEVAIKKLHSHVADSAHRELEIVEALFGRTLTHVMPILDAGSDEDTGEYFIVMPKAEKSLQEAIDGHEVNGEEGAVAIIREIAKGLQEVSDIAHRDLKPGNVLFHEGRWKVADFGIARFVERATSLRTLKESLTPLYAAPEQWRLERSTAATDVYALGCIAHALVTGVPPFLGPDLEDYKRQHLNEAPQPLTSVSPRFAMMVASMLRKHPVSRPGIERIIELSDGIIHASAGAASGPNPLAQAGAVAVERALQAEATQSEEEGRRQERLGLATFAREELISILKKLWTSISNDAPTAQLSGNTVAAGIGPLLLIRFGSAMLRVVEHGKLYEIEVDAFPNSGWDVICGVVIKVTQSQPKKYEWSANLWYTNLGQGNPYRWYEVLYFKLASSHPLAFEPTALIDLEDADLAASMVMHMFSLAAKPCPIDDEDTESFIERWSRLLALAYSGQLERPRYLPLSG